MAPHSPYGPSASGRWINCPGSNNLINQLGPAADTAPSKYALVGIAQHELTETCLRLHHLPFQYIGETFSGVTIETEHAEAALLCLETIQNDWLDDGGELKLEVRFNLNLVPGLDTFGTCDACLISDKLLRIYDFKFGRGVSVEVQNNPQLMMYALGAMQSLKQYSFKEVESIVIQPLRPHRQGPVRRQRVDILDVTMDFTNKVIDAIKATLKPDAPLHAGNWCTFCPARGQCPELKNQALNTLHADFNGALPVPALLTPAQIGDLLSQIEMVDDFVRAVKERALQIAESGTAIPNWKLVAKRATRKWLSEEAVPLFLSSLPKEKLYDMKLKSPRQIELLLPKERRKELEPLYQRVSSGNTLVPITDVRQSARPAVETDFVPQE